jgi:hypothetical protein
MTWKWMFVPALAFLVVQVGCNTSGSPASATPAKPQAAPAAHAAPMAASVPSTRPVTALKSAKDLRSYSIGVDTARNFKKLGFDIDVDVMMQGMKDVAAGNRLLATDDMIRNSMMEI